MSDDTNVTPATPPAGDLPPTVPDPKPAEKRLLDELKQAKAKLKEQEAKLAEALPYVEKFKGHEEAKSLEAQRRAEADADASRKREARERAIRDEVLYGLMSTGRKIERKGVALILSGAMSTESGITLDDDGKVAGVEEYLTSVFSTFGPTPPAEPARKPAPGLPETKGTHANAQPTFASIAELDVRGPAFVLDYSAKHPEEYAALVAAHNAAMLKPRRQTMPAPQQPQR